MPKRIEFEGQIHEFPDGVTDDQIRAALQGYLGQQQGTGPGADHQPAFRAPRPTWASGLGVPKALQPPVDFLEGIKAGVASTAYHGGDLIRRGQNWLADVTGIEGLRTERVIESPEAQLAMTAPPTLAGAGGKFAEQATEFVVPAARVAKATKAAPLSQRIAAEGATAGTVGAVQSGGDPGHTALAAGLGAAGPAVGAGLKAAGNLRGPRLLSENPNVAQREALGALEAEGVLVGPGAKSGSPWWRAIEWLNARSFGGAKGAQETQARNVEALRRRAGELAQEAYPKAVSPEQAGTGLAGAMTRKAERFRRQADQAYDTFRQVEADPRNLGRVEVGTRPNPNLDQVAQGLAGQPYQSLLPEQQAAVRQTAERLGLSTKPVPVMKDIPLPVYAGGIKAEIAPVLERLERTIGVPQLNQMRGYSAVKWLMKEDDWVPASIAEDALSGLKALAREGSGRDAGIAKFLIPKLQKVIDDGVAHAPAGGGKGLGMLRRARRSSAVQHGTQEIAQQLRQEPVQTFGQATWAKDANIRLMREINREAPGELVKVGRAWIDDLTGKAVAGGGFDNAASMWAKWRDLGPGSKKLLFPDAAYREALGKFFLGVKTLAENPNPSGSALVGHAGVELAGWATAVGAAWATGGASLLPALAYTFGHAGLSRILHSTRGLRLLSAGMTVPLGAKGPQAARAAAITSQLLHIAGKEAKPAGGKVVEMPKAASAPTTGPERPKLSDLLAMPTAAGAGTR